MMKPDPILLDQDGVLADFVKGLYQECERRLGADFKYMPDPALSTTFYIEDSVNTGDPERDIWLKNQIVDVVDTWDGMFRDLEPIPGAIEWAEFLKNEAAKHDIAVRICTAPHVEHRTCHSDKAAWAAKHMGDQWAKQMILSHDKTIVRGLVLVDDKPKLNGTLDPDWVHLVFDSPYNKDSTALRVYGWSETAAWTILHAALQRMKDKKHGR